MADLVTTGKVILNRFSRFRGTDILREGSVEFFATFPIPAIPDRADDRFHEVGAGEDGRLDLISYRYYATAELWWVIAVANDIFFPMREVIPGIVLRVPSSDFVFGTLVT